MVIMWFDVDSGGSGNAFIALPKLFSPVVPFPRPLAGELWSTVPKSSPVLYLRHGCETALGTKHLFGPARYSLSSRNNCTAYRYL